MLSQLTRSKEETADPIARTTQSITLNIDTLKGLLGKSNGGVSLAKLLNKQPGDAVVNTQEEDPGECALSLLTVFLVEEMSMIRNQIVDKWKASKGVSH